MPANYSEALLPVLVRLQSEPGGVALAVMDKGPGIPEVTGADLRALLTRWSTRSNHSKPGMGLGLYIAEQIVDAHGGRIWCEPGKVGFCLSGHVRVALSAVVPTTVSRPVSLVNTKKRMADHSAGKERFAVRSTELGA